MAQSSLMDGLSMAETRSVASQLSGVIKFTLMALHLQHSKQMALSLLGEDQEVALLHSYPVE